MLTETNLNSKICDSEFDLPEFKIFKKDRDENTSNTKCGGGIFLAARKSRKSIPSYQILSNDLTTECLFVALNFPSVAILLSVVYILPNSPNDTCNNYVLAVNDVCDFFCLKKDSKIFLINDFNLPHDDCFQANSSDLTSRSYIHVPQCGNVILDISSHKQRVGED